MLLRSFSRSVDPVELRPPAWDIALVLQSLTRALYEPLRTCYDRFLAQKTLFLLGLASAKRIGELHALSYRVSHSRNWDEVSSSFVPGFVAGTKPSRGATLKRPKVGLFGKGCSSLVRVPQILHLAPLPVEVADLLRLVSRKGRCSSQRHCSSSRGLSNTLTPRQGLVCLCG